MPGETIRRSSASPKVSIVVPFFNEEDSVAPLYASLTAALQRESLSYELVFVDDGSADATFAKAVELARNDPRIRVIKFRRNYGQTAAMAAGLEYARGQVLVTMDGDLQNDPDDIVRLLQKVDEGFDIVVGWRHRRQDKLITRKLPSRAANWLIGKVTGVPIHDNGCSLKAFRAAVIKAIPLYSEMHRFIPAMASIAGPRIAEIKVNHHARQFGRSKYGLSRIYKVALDLLVIKTISTFTSRPFIWFSILSVPAVLLAGAALSYVLFVVLIRGQPLPLSAAGSAFIFLSGAFMLQSSGAIGELVFKFGDIRDRNFARLTEQRVDALHIDRRRGQTL